MGHWPMVAECGQRTKPECYQPRYLDIGNQEQLSRNNGIVTLLQFYSISHTTYIGCVFSLIPLAEEQTIDLE